MKELRWRCEETKSHALFSFFFYFFILFHVLYIMNYWEQRPPGALAMAKKKPHLLSFYPPRHQGKTYQPKSLLYETDHIPARQNRKSNSD